MNTRAKNIKIPATLIMELDKKLTEAGFKDGNKTGSFIMPAPKRLQSVKQQQDSQKQTEKTKE